MDSWHTAVVTFELPPLLASGHKVTHERRTRVLLVLPAPTRSATRAKHYTRHWSRYDKVVTCGDDTDRAGDRYEYMVFIN